MGRIRFLLLAVTLICLKIDNSSAAAIAATKKEVEVITQPRPGEEFVLVQTAKSQSTTSSTPQAFSTSHQIPSIKEKQEKTKAAAEENTKFTTSHRVTRPAKVPVKENSKLIKVVSGESLSNKKRGARQTGNSGAELEVNIEDEGQTGVIDEFEEADTDERKILARKAEPVVRKQGEKKETNLKPKPVHEEVEEEDIIYEDEVKEEKPLSSSRTPTRIENVKEQEQEQEEEEEEAQEREVVNPPAQKRISTNKATETASLNVPVAKQTAEEKYDIVSVGNNAGKAKKVSDEGTYDFVDTPLTDKVLTPSGTSQASRVNVKKGPNGQDYEYEYVYYYYDDEDEAGGGKGTKNTFNSHDGPVSSKSTTASPSIRGSPTTARHQTPVPTEPSVSANNVRSRRPEHTQEEEPIQSSANQANSKQRYTTIERTRGQGDQVPTTPEPASNEVLPPSTRGSNRFRGRQIPASSGEDTVAPVSEERLPANTRFPPRSRSNHNSSPSSTTPTTQTDTPITRVRGNSGSVKRPSLELVDSSSFRTHASDVSPDQDQIQPLPFEGSDAAEPVQRGQGRIRIRPSQATPAAAVAQIPKVTEEGTLNVAVIPQTYVDSSKFPAATTREQDLEEYIQPQRPANRQRVPATHATEIPSTYFSPDIAETTENVLSSGGVTTIKEAGRTRYRGGNGNTRTRARPSAYATSSTTTENPDEGTTKRTRFQPSKTRIEGQISAYGRRGSKKPIADQSESGSNVEEEVTPRTNGRGRYKTGGRGSQNSATTTTEAPPTEAKSRPTFGGSDRFNSRRRAGGVRGSSTTSLPHDEETGHQESESGDGATATTTVRPTRPKLNIAGGARPLRPGPKINIGGRARIGGPSTQAPVTATEQDLSTSPLPEEQPADVHEQPAEVTTAAPDALTRLRNRPRLRVGEKQAAKPQPAPAQAANRRQLVSGLLPKRLKPNQPAETTSELPPEEEKPVEENPQEESEASETIPAVASTTEQPSPATPESKLSSLIGNRRRIGGRRPGTLISRPTPEE
ncbi:uncharacterized protein LOC142319523 isoform X3 [Lycorma delicatula]|uniref:uncharacterized protein LOC142319523 isoform X3 n=1 Tax=Lycorma delicatula TaxID=130591 RepID=UPI003F513B91